jgi:hypothetical protein
MTLRPSSLTVRSSSTEPTIKCPAHIPTSVPRAQPTKPLRSEKAKSKGRIAKTVCGPYRASPSADKNFELHSALYHKFRLINEISSSGNGAPDSSSVDLVVRRAPIVPGEGGPSASMPGRGCHVPIHALRLLAGCLREESISAGQGAQGLVARAIKDRQLSFWSYRCYPGQMPPR